MVWAIDEEDGGLGTQILLEFAEAQAPETLRVMYLEDARVRGKTAVYGRTKTPEQIKLAKQRRKAKEARIPALRELHLLEDRAYAKRTYVPTGRPPGRPRLYSDEQRRQRKSACERRRRARIREQSR